MWYKLLGAPSELPEHNVTRVGKEQRTFMVGNMMHYRYAMLFSRMGILQSREFPIKVQWGRGAEQYIVGRGDDLLNLYDTISWQYEGDGRWGLKASGKLKKHIVDIKSAKGRSFAEMVKSKSPGASYEDQLQCYLQAEQCEGSIFAECKDDQHTAEFVFAPDKQLWLRITESVKETAEKVRTLTPPDKIEGAAQDRFPCGWCDKAHICWSPQKHDKFLDDLKREKHEKGIKHAPSAQPSKISSLPGIKRPVQAPTVSLPGLRGALRRP